MIRDFSAGDVIPVTVWKDGSAHVRNLRSITFPEALAEELAYERLGVRVKEISAVLRRKFGIASRDGMMVTELRRGCHLYRMGVRPGDVIRKINEVVVRTVDDFKGAAIKYRHKESVVLVVQRGNDQYYVTVKVGV